MLDGLEENMKAITGKEKISNMIKRETAIFAHAEIFWFAKGKYS